MKRYNLALNNSYDKYVFFMFSLCDRYWVTQYHVNTSMLISSAKNSFHLEPDLAQSLQLVCCPWGNLGLQFIRNNIKQAIFAVAFQCIPNIHEALNFSLGPWARSSCEEVATVLHQRSGSLELEAPFQETDNFLRTMTVIWHWTTHLLIKLESTIALVKTDSRQNMNYLNLANLIIWSYVIPVKNLQHSGPYVLIYL